MPTRFGSSGASMAQIDWQDEGLRKMGIPYISLDTSVHREPPTEEQLTRVKAFIEMLS
ncbi:MAG: 2-hydroxyacyl-CoA dehydratase family protein [Terracidiphilus sp.]